LHADHIRTGRLSVLLTLILIAAALHGCGNANVLTGVVVDPDSRPPDEGSYGFYVSGIGKCDTLRMDWGDGNVELLPNYDLTQKTPIFHKFAGWGGGRTVTAIGASGCEGTVQTRFNDALLAPTNIAFGAGPLTCVPVTTRPPLAGRTLIHLTTTPVSGEYSYGIDFGCPAGGCRYNADGKPDSSAPSRFPFPGLREFSLVIRVGSEVFQGGTDERFTSTQTAPLEICINDDNLTDNRGGYQINITTDQLGPDLTAPTGTQ
jgi:hypothetical protein